MDEDKRDELMNTFVNNCRAVVEFPLVQPNVLELIECSQNDQNHSRKADKPRKVKRERFKGYTNASREEKMRKACATNNIEMAEFYLKKGTNPNAQDYYKRTALHFAAGHGFTNIVDLLLEYGADCKMLDILGNNPLHLAACCSSKFTMVESLCKAGSSLEELNRNGNNPLDLAKSKLKILSNRTSAISGNPEEANKIIQDFQKIVNIMTCFVKKSQNSDELLANLSSRIASLSTKDDVQSEITSLLDQIDSLKL